MIETDQKVISMILGFHDRVCDLLREGMDLFLEQQVDLRYNIV